MTDAHALAVALADRLIGAGLDDRQVALLVTLRPHSVRAGTLTSTVLVREVGLLSEDVRRDWAGSAVELLRLQGMPALEARLHVSGVLRSVDALRSAGRHFWRDPDALFRGAPDA